MKTHLTIAAALLLAACSNESPPAEKEADQPTATAGTAENEGTEPSAPADAPAEQTVAQNQPPAEADPAPLAAPDAALGRKEFNACAVCHSVDEGGAARVGPNLFGVYGQPAGQRDGFAYSPALRDSGLTWDDETLDAFIENPQTLVSRNRMAYPGQRDAQKRANIIAYIKTLQP